MDTNNDTVTVQVLSESHSENIGVLKITAGLGDSLLGLQRETESLRRLKAELQQDNNNRGTVTHSYTVFLSG